MNKATSRIFLAAALLVAGLVLAGCDALLGGRLTPENCNKIQDGMTLDQVTAILGPPTDTKSLGAGPLTATTVTWEDEKMRINVKFLNDKSGLKSCNSKEKTDKKSGG